MIHDPSVRDARRAQGHGGAVRTSDSHPLWIDEVPAGAGGGVIGVTFCPGKHDHASGGFRWERSLSADLDAIAGWKAQTVLTLIEDHESAMLKVTDLGKKARRRGLTWHHLPITDVRPPDARFEAAWGMHGTSLINALRAGGRVVVHCRGGLGRAGTVAARMLVELGHDGADAVDRVRRARPGAIETRSQFQYVMGLSGRRAQTSDAGSNSDRRQEGYPHGLV